MLLIDPISCLEWPHARLKHGYGIVGVLGKTRTVHRFIFEFFSGEKLGRRDFICHKCNNPSCLNPHHLYKGDGKTNAADRKAAGTQKGGYANPEIRARGWAANRGKKRSAEARAKMSKALLGRPSWNKGTRGVMKPNSGSFAVGKDAPNKGRKRIVDENGKIRFIRET